MIDRCCIFKPQRAACVESQTYLNATNVNQVHAEGPGDEVATNVSLTAWRQPSIESFHGGPVGAETMKQFCMKIDLISQRRENVLFLPSNMAAMTSHENAL